MKKYAVLTILLLLLASCTTNNRKAPISETKSTTDISGIDAKTQELNRQKAKYSQLKAQNKELQSKIEKVSKEIDSFEQVENNNK